MSELNDMSFKLKYLAGEYGVKTVVWIASDNEVEHITFTDCVAQYLATEDCFWVHDGHYLRRYLLTGIYAGGYED